MNTKYFQNKKLSENSRSGVFTQDSLDRQWERLSVSEVVAAFKSNLTAGLTQPEVAERQERFGANQLTPQKKTSAWMRFLQQFNQPLLYILIGAGLVTLLLQEWVDAGVIFGVVLINAIVGYIQEAKAEKAMEALAKSMVTKTRVIRDRTSSRLASSSLVPGDIVCLEAGDKVPADLRLLQCKHLQINESTLTGESVPVDKDTKPLEEETSLGDRLNMAYAGTIVTAGQGRGIVVAIAEATETGKISTLMEQQTNLTSPIVRKLEKFSWQLLYVFLGLATLIIVVGLGQGKSWIEMFQTAVALAVSGIPEQLPPLVTIILAIGVSRMASRHAIVRKLPAVETLGSATVICSDKTGTLTENQMTVEAIYAGGQHYRVTGTGYSVEGEILQDNQSIVLEADRGLRSCLQCGLLCNDSHLKEHNGQLTVEGDPTEGAMIVVTEKARMHRATLERKLPRIDVIPFASEHQYMATLHQNPRGGRIIYVKGSTEAILSRCDLGEGNGRSAVEAQAIESIAEQMAGRGLRVLALARKSVDSQLDSLSRKQIDCGLTFLGLQGMIDPPRQEAVRAVKACQTAGIGVKMITGDHAVTASAIAHMLNLSQGEIQALSGKSLEQMSDQELNNAVEDTMVFARVAPKQKLRLIETLQAKGEIVAMTGDGVNDAPALKQADIGIAMGKSGTEVAKEAADIILTDDNFASIEAAVEEGRTVYFNLRKAIAFVLPVNGGEALTILAGVLLGTVLPILPLQILWINMVSSSSLSIPLAFEPQPKNLMRSPPRQPNEPLLTSSILWRIVVISLFNWAATFGIFEWVVASTGEEALARTMAVQTLVAAEIFYLLCISRFIPSLFAKIRDRREAIQRGLARKDLSASESVVEVLSVEETVEGGGFPHERHRGFASEPSAKAMAQKSAVQESFAYAPGIGIICIVVLQILFSQLSVMNALFETVPLSLTQWVICLGAGLPVVIFALLLKRFKPLS